MEQQVVTEENKKAPADIFQGFLDNPLISQVSNTVINTFTEHIKNSNHHEINDKQQDSGVDDIEEAFQKIDHTKKDNNLNDITHDVKEEEKKKEHNPINDFFNNQFGAQIGGFVGNITNNVIETVKNELVDSSFDNVHEDSRSKTPEPTKEEFVLPNDHEKHPQEPSGIDLGKIMSTAQDILANNGDKIHEIVQNIIPSVLNEEHKTETPQEPQTDTSDKSKGNSNNMSIPKVDIIAPSPLPSDRNENAPSEPNHDFKEPSTDDIIDEIQEEFSCVQLKGYTTENNNDESLVDVRDDESNNVEIEKGVNEPSVVDVHEEVLIKKENSHEGENVLVNHEITIQPREEIKHNEPFVEIKQEVEEIKHNEPFVEIKQEVEEVKHNEPFVEIKQEVEEIKHEEPFVEIKQEVEEIKHSEPVIEIKQEVEEKVQIPPPVSVPIQAEVKKTPKTTNDKKTTTTTTTKTTTTQAKPRVPPSTTKTTTKTTTTTTRTVTSSKPTPSKTATPRVTGTEKTVTKTTVTSDKVPSYARPTGASTRASTVGNKSSPSTASSKAGSVTSSSAVRPLPRVTNKYKDVKSKVFTTVTTTQTTTEKPSTKPTPKPPSNGIKPLPKTKLNWKAESKVGSFANIQHKPAGGHVKLINQKLNWNVSSKVGSIDNSLKNKTSNNKPAPPTTKIGDVKAELPGNINPLSAKEALGQ
uniref:Microtubule-associated protein n=1 Tax=Strongyloides papillosus TaxID=174720 RepID=A0A0N5C0C1_STREA